MTLRVNSQHHPRGLPLTLTLRDQPIKARMENGDTIPSIAADERPSASGHQLPFEDADDLTAYAFCDQWLPGVCGNFCCVAIGTSLPSGKIDR
jgi:hypothetical protein